jgi:hypothetical protein
MEQGVYARRTLPDCCHGSPFSINPWRHQGLTLGNFQPRDVHKPGFEALGMLRRRGASSAPLCANHQGRLGFTAEHIADFGDLADELVHGDGGKIDVHQLGDRRMPTSVVPNTAPTTATEGGLGSILKGRDTIPTPVSLGV